MAEVLEIQIQDKGAVTSGTPRPPAAPSPTPPVGSPASAPAATRPKDQENEDKPFAHSLLDWFEKELPRKLAALRRFGSAEGLGGLLKNYGFSRSRDLLPEPPGANIGGLLQEQLVVLQDIRSFVARGGGGGSFVERGAGGVGRQGHAPRTTPHEPRTTHHEPRTNAPRTTPHERTAEAAAGEEGVAGEALAGAGETAAVEEGVGGLVDALGAAEGGLAALGPAGVAVGVVLGGAAIAAAAAIGAFGLGLHLATDEIRVFGLKLSSSVDQLAAFSGPLAAAQANADIREIMDDIKESRQTGNDLARIVDAQSEAQHQMRELWLPIKKVITEIVAGIMEVLADWLKDARVLLMKEFWSELIDDLIAGLKPTIAGGISIAEATARLSNKFDELKASLDKESNPETDFWLRDLYETPWDHRPAAEAFRGLEQNPRPHLPLVVPFPGL